jgi:hypothetical protein
LQRSSSKYFFEALYYVKPISQVRQNHINFGDNSDTKWLQETQSSRKLNYVLYIKYKDKKEDYSIPENKIDSTKENKQKHLLQDNL